MYYVLLYKARSAIKTLRSVCNSAQKEDPIPPFRKQNASQAALMTKVITRLSLCTLFSPARLNPTLERGERQPTEKHLSSLPEAEEATLVAAEDAAEQSTKAQKSKKGKKGKKDICNTYDATFIYQELEK